MNYHPSARRKPAAVAPNRTAAAKRGVGIFTFLVILFVALQATGSINWPLWLILMPWIAVAVLVCIIFIAGVLAVALKPKPLSFVR